MEISPRIEHYLTERIQKIITSNLNVNHGDLKCWLTNEKPIPWASEQDNYEIQKLQWGTFIINKD